MGVPCREDCGYRCMRGLEVARLEVGFIPAKFSGKWNFVRVAGVQEFASSAASVVNGAVHAWYMPMMLRHRRAWLAKGAARGSGSGGGGGGGGSGGGGGFGSFGGGGVGEGSPFATLWICNAVISMNAWLWSTVFHARDTRATRTMDYASANVLFFWSLFEAAARAFSWRSPRQYAPFAALVAALLMVGGRGGAGGGAHHITLSFTHYFHACISVVKVVKKLHVQKYLKSKRRNGRTVGPRLCTGYSMIKQSRMDEKTECMTTCEDRHPTTCATGRTCFCTISTIASTSPSA